MALDRSVRYIGGILSVWISCPFHLLSTYCREKLLAPSYPFLTPPHTLNLGVMWSGLLLCHWIQVSVCRKHCSEILLEQP